MRHDCTAETRVRPKRLCRRHTRGAEGEGGSGRGSGTILRIIPVFFFPISAAIHEACDPSLKQLRLIRIFSKRLGRMHYLFNNRVLRLLFVMSHWSEEVRVISPLLGSAQQPQSKHGKAGACDTSNLFCWLKTRRFSFLFLFLKFLVLLVYNTVILEILVS